ncbi:MAG: DUF4397 domain-containing protein [Myxococcota bacterium]
MSLAAFGFSACGDDDGGGGDTDMGMDVTDMGGGGGGTGEVRFWHLADEAGPVDIFVDGVAIDEGVDFEINSDYIEFDAGTLDIAIAPAGAGVGAAVIEASLPLGDGESYTIIAAQLGAEPAAFAALPILEDRSAPADGNVNLRVFHAAYGVPTAVDVHVVDEDTNPEVLAGLAQGTAAMMPVSAANAATTLGLDLEGDGTIDVQTEDALGPFTVDSVTIGAITKLVMEDGELEAETEIVFLPGEGGMIHDETELVPFGGEEE